MIIISYPQSYKKTVAKPKRSQKNNPNNDVQLNLSIGIDNFCGTLKSKPHLLPLVWPTTVKSTIKFVAPVSHVPFNLKSILQTVYNNPPVSQVMEIFILVAFLLVQREGENLNGEASFAALASCPEMKALVDVIIDPDFPQRKLRRFYVLCWSPATPGKKDPVNWALLLFLTGFYIEKDGVSCIDLVKDPQNFADAQYKPTTVQTKFEMMFTVFSQHDSHYSVLINNQGMSLVI